MNNFWDYSVWGTLNIIAALLISLLAGNVLKTKRTVYITMMIAAFVAKYFLEVNAILIIAVCLGIGLTDLGMTLYKKRQGVA